MKVKSIKIKNFYSYENAELSFEELDNLIYVDGKNKDAGGSNGSGKSSLFEAVVWGLTGKTIRKSIEDAVVNFNNTDSCVVDLEVDDYRIIRGKRPSKLQLFYRDEEITKESQKVTQEFLEKQLGFTYKSIVSTMVYGQNSPTEFLGATKDEKRAIIKHYLDLDDVFRYRDRSKASKLDISREIKAHETLISKLDSQIEQLKQDLGTDVNEPVYDLAVIQKLESKVSEAQMEARSIKQEVAFLKSTLSPAGQADTCNTCGQKIPEEDIQKVKDDREQTEERIEKLQEKLEEHHKVIDSTNIPISSSDLVQSMKAFKDLSDKEQIQYKISEKSEQIEELKKELGSLKLSYELFKFWESGFSEKGLIRYIIRSILNKFNEIANHYLKVLTNEKFSIYFDDQLEETIFYNNKIVHYISLSGGEKNRVDLAIMLALQQIPALLQKQTIDIILFDEIGGFLDDEGIEALYILLRELNETKKLFIITHNSTLKNKLRDCCKLTIIKKEESSRIQIDKGYDG